MKQRTLYGILTLITAASMLTLTVLIWTQGAMFKAIYAKLAMLNLTALVSFSGFYLIESQAHINRRASVGIKLLGFILIIFGALVSFDIIDYRNSWNVLIGVGIVYITLIQLQLIHWEKSKKLLKIMGLITFLTNAFIAIYFFTRLSSASFGLIFDISIILSVFSFLIALILKRAQELKKDA